MTRRNAQVFEAEITDLDESIDGSAPTVVISAAPLPVCMRTSTPTIREVPVERLPGRPLGERPRRARVWANATPLETAPVGPIPMPGERASAEVVTVVQRMRVDARPPLATRACQPPVQYSVEREVSELTAPRRMARRAPRESRRHLLLVLIIGMLAGFVTVLSIVVVQQQRALTRIDRSMGDACDTYAEEVRATAQELTAAAGAAAEVEGRIGERARAVVNDRVRQQLCGVAPAASCAASDTACFAAAVMRLRQATSRR